MRLHYRYNPANNSGRRFNSLATKQTCGDRVVSESGGPITILGKYVVDAQPCEDKTLHATGLCGACPFSIRGRCPCSIHAHNVKRHCPGMKRVGAAVVLLGNRHEIR